jgi:hypothetical protein
MRFIARILGGLKARFLLRAWVLGAVFWGLMAWMFATHGREPERYLPTLAYLVVSTVLFPFSKLVWNELRSFVLGDNIVFLPVIFMLPAKLIVNFVLWFLAVFIAPLGIGYIWLRTRALAEPDVV